jgi:glyoxylase-like metal-dependent hydrolase (beta-lactamase superfamily II)
MMRRSVVPLVLVFLLAACSQSGAPPIKDDFPLTRISDRIFVLYGANETPTAGNHGVTANSGFVITSKGVVVVDPGSSLRAGELVQRKINSVTGEPVVAVFVTHMHGEQWLGDQAIKAAWPKAVIYAHAKTLAAASVEGEAWLRLLNSATGGAGAGSVVQPPDLAVESEDVLKIGDRHFRVHGAAKAHTDSDIMIEVIEDKAVFLGDVVCAGRIGPMEDGAFAGNIGAIERVLKTGAQHWIPAHGNGGGREVVTAWRDYLGTLFETVKKRRDGGQTESELRPKTIEALSAYRAWKDFDNQVTRHIGIAFREAGAL